MTKEPEHEEMRDASEEESETSPLVALVDFLEESLPGLRYTSSRPIHFTHPAMATLRQIAQLATVLVTAGDATLEALLAEFDAPQDGGE